MSGKKFNRKSAAIRVNNVPFGIAGPIAKGAVDVPSGPPKVVCSAQGGVDVCPGSGGPHGGASVWPARAYDANTITNTLAGPNFLTVFMFSP